VCPSPSSPLLSLFVTSFPLYPLTDQLTNDQLTFLYSLPLLPLLSSLN
jgi:hypothetical protein